MKTDPEDGKSYSLASLREKYKGRFSKSEIDSYWKSSCEMVEARTDPEDGKSYTLAEMQEKYRKTYSPKAVSEYFKSECTLAPKSFKPPSRKSKGASQGWPEGYPLPLIPPASLKSIEEVAEHSRRSQVRKEQKSSQIRSKWSSLSYEVSAKPQEKTEKKQSKRWARAQGA